jgi:hypothetical protein
MHFNGNVLQFPDPPPPMPPRQPPPVVEVERISGTHLLLIPHCPFCGKKHMHGSGSKMTCGDHGHRVSHCTSRGPWYPNSGYYLFEPCTSATAAKPKTARPRRRRVKRELLNIRREADPHVRAALLRRLLHRHGLSNTEINVVLAALDREHEKPRR